MMIRSICFAVLIATALVVPAQANDWELTGGLSYSQALKIDGIRYERDLLLNVQMAQPMAFTDKLGTFVHLSTSLDGFRIGGVGFRGGQTFTSTNLGIGLTHRIGPVITLAVAPGFSYQQYGLPKESRFRYNTHVGLRFGPPENDFKFTLTYDTAVRALGINVTVRHDFLLNRF